MSSSAVAAFGFLLLLLPLQVLAKPGWEVIYHQPEDICAVRGSTVSINCTYKHPATEIFDKSFWFIATQEDPLGKEKSYDLQLPLYKKPCNRNICTLTISNVTQRNSAEYRFRFFTTSYYGRYTGWPGVRLTVSDLQVNVRSFYRDSPPYRLSCDTKCNLTGRRTYTWYMNDKPFRSGRTLNLQTTKPGDEYTCRVSGSQVGSPAVYAPRTPTLSTDPSHNILEGDQLTVMCRSDANPPANYSWFNRSQSLHHYQAELIIKSVQSSDSREYSCRAENQLGGFSSHILIDVQYGPKSSSVSVTGETVEGRPVTLSCSSDANPEANYTWFKDGNKVFEGQKYQFPNIRTKDSGSYHCKSENQHGSIESSPKVLNVQSSADLCTMNVIKLTLVVSLPPALLIFILWTCRKKKTRSSCREPQADEEMIEPQSPTALLSPLFSTSSKRGICSAAMSSSAVAAFGFLLLLLPLQVLAQPGWEVIYNDPKDICAVRGSTVSINCTYKHPATEIFDKSFWFIATQEDPLGKEKSYDLQLPLYKKPCNRNICTLTISNVTQRNSAEYRFRFFTTSYYGRYTGWPGVRLTVSDLQVNVRSFYRDSPPYRLSCDTKCNLTGRRIYTWYMNDKPFRSGRTLNLQTTKPGDEYTCRVSGSQVGSPAVYAPRTPTLSTDPSHNILEGDQLTVMCRSDANPPANYSWFNRSQSLHHYQAELIIKSVKSSDSREYSCRAENQLGGFSSHILIDVQYGPKSSSVSVTGETVEGRPVTLSCSSDANPEANYTWFKDGNKVFEGQKYQFPNIRTKDSGSYHCKSENQHGSIESSPKVLNISSSTNSQDPGNWKLPLVGVTVTVLLLFFLLVVFLLIRKKTTTSQKPCEAEGVLDNGEEVQADVPEENRNYASVHFTKRSSEPLYCNVRAPGRSQTDKDEDGAEYTVIRWPITGATFSP
ncbi:cell adhesion molecule CEACAM5-like [Nelusetta ayraudi]|uniref:cell adhesion molecule CEACAM5-like n=1 Tax=Nelusetta ayraudi TaxID=303726 RepID=UPI003F70359E